MGLVALYHVERTIYRCYPCILFGPLVSIGYEAYCFYVAPSDLCYF
jgi:hypothetical protein